jgi:hypothetical protein
MKKILLPLFAICLLITGCLENTQEITINADGSGTLSSTSDMSAIMGLAKQMGGAEMESLPDEKMDTTISMKEGADSIPGLTEVERELVRTGTLKVNMDLAGEKFMTNMLFPFKNPGEIATLNKLSSKIITETIKNKAGGEGDNPMGGEEMPEMSSFDDYFSTVYSKGLIVKTLNAEKYATVDSDQFLAGVKQTAAMGLLMKSTYIINLPSPATRAEGKGLTLSEDKKKVTIVADINDFFDEPSKLEFRIEY